VLAAARTQAAVREHRDFGARRSGRALATSAAVARGGAIPGPRSHRSVGRARTARGEVKT